MDPPLELFRRQYFQLFDVDLLAWPPKILLRDAAVQSWLYASLFDTTKNDRLPPVRYRFRVVKKLIAKIEDSIEDPNEHELCDNLVNHLSDLISSPLPSEVIATQQKTYVTFSCLGRDDPLDLSPEPTLTLLERPYLISGSLTTGYRTWEAALHLGTYLLSPAGRILIANKNVLELGAGTGFLSVLCAKHLDANHVTTTDGDEGVVEALNENLFLNNLDNDTKVHASVLRWGHGLRGTWVEEDCAANPFDVVLGSDITYDKVAISALVSTFVHLLNLRPDLKIIIAGAVRNVETYVSFWDACQKASLVVAEIDFAPQPIRSQKALFYATAAPLKIVSISRAIL